MSWAERPGWHGTALQIAAPLQFHLVHAPQIFELDSFRVTHASRYPAPVLSLGISPDCGLLAVGMADGALSVRRHARPKREAAADGAAGPRARQR